MEKYNEIFRLKDMIEKENIEYDFNNLYDGYQIKITYEDKLIISVIEHEFSYDNKRDLVEFMYIGSAPISINAYAAFMFIKDILELKKHYNNTGRTYQMPIVVYDKNSKYNIKDWFIAEI